MFKPNLLLLFLAILTCLPAAAAETPLAVPTTAAHSANAHYLDMPVPQLLALLDDPSSRLPETFKVPTGLKPLVGFWFQIYAKYSLYQTLIYDKDNQEIVYEVIDNRDYFQRGLSPVVLEISINNRVKKAIAGYKSAMAQLQKNPKAKFKPGTPGDRLVKLWGRKSSRDWAKAQENVRTQPGQRDKIMDGIANGERFFPAMESIFKKLGIPPEITRLPLVESSFNLQAVSKVDAVGVWQFMHKSATEYLVVDSYNKIDERLSPIKSTYAAAKMFKRNHTLLKDWGLAIIAYNHGAKNLVPIRDKFKGEKITQLLSMTKKTPLGYASRNFYAEFLAALYAEKYRDQLYGMKTTLAPSAISIVRMKKPASVFELAALYGISIHELRVFNPDIFDLKRKLPAGTRIVLPRKHGESLVEAPKIESIGAGEKPSRGLASEVEFIDYIK